MVVVLSAWLGCALLLAPATTFAAAAGRYGRSSCGWSSEVHLAVVTSQTVASIWLNHTSGPIGTWLVISGAGWPAGAAVTIDAYGDNGAGHPVLGQAAIAQARTYSDGTFQTAPFAAPTDCTCGRGADYGAPGSFVLFRAHTHGNPQSPPVRFTYLVTPSLNATSVPDWSMGIMPGSVIPITGQDWGPDQWVTVTTGVIFGQTQAELENTGAAQPSGTPPMQVQANGHGAFTTKVAVPNDVPFFGYSDFVVSATATNPLFGTFTVAPLVLNILPQRTPTFTASLTQGLPGTVVTLKGTNWPLGMVLVDYCRGQTHADGSTHIGCYPGASQGIGFALINGAPGTFSIEVTIPPNARPGLITLQASADSDILTNVYTLDLPFDILTPSAQIPWQVVHPRLAQALLVGDGAVPLLLLIGGGAGAVVLWRRRRRSWDAAGGITEHGEKLAGTEVPPP